MICTHNRTAAACEECQHAAALADERRAQFTRKDLHPDIGQDSGILSETAEEAKPAPRRRGRRRDTPSEPVAL